MTRQMVPDKTDLLRQMHIIRALEEMAERLYAIGKVQGTMHLAMRMEAPAVGAVAALRPKDLMFSTHRGHGYCMAKGADLNLMMAEFLGKANGYCRRRGSSMHNADLAGGHLGANGNGGEAVSRRPCTWDWASGCKDATKSCSASSATAQRIWGRSTSRWIGR